MGSKTLGGLEGGGGGGVWNLTRPTPSTLQMEKKREDQSALPAHSLYTYFWLKSANGLICAQCVHNAQCTVCPRWHTQKSGKGKSTEKALCDMCCCSNCGQTMRVLWHQRPHTALCMKMRFGPGGGLLLCWCSAETQMHATVQVRIHNNESSRDKDDARPQHRHVLTHICRHMQHIPSQEGYKCASRTGANKARQRPQLVSHLPGVAQSTI